MIGRGVCPGQAPVVRVPPKHNGPAGSLMPPQLTYEPTQLGNTEGSRSSTFDVRIT